MAIKVDTENEVRAEAKWVRMSARKARVVTDHIRGRSVPEARTVLAFTPRAAERRGERRGEPQSCRRRPGRLRRVRRRGSDDQALASPGARAGRPRAQADLSHHCAGRAFGGTRTGLFGERARAP